MTYATTAGVVNGGGDRSDSGNIGANHFTITASKSAEQLLGSSSSAAARFGNCTRNNEDHQKHSRPGSRQQRSQSVWGSVLDRTTSASVPANHPSMPDNNLDAQADMLDICRSSSEIALRSLMQHTENSNVSRTIYFSSDNGSNASSSSGDDNPSRLYKFKSNMKHRFSVDLEHSQTTHPAKKPRRDAGSSSSNYDKFDTSSQVNNYSSVHQDINDIRDTNSNSVDKFVNSDVRPISMPETIQRSDSCVLPKHQDALKALVPIFAFNQSGSFYVPMFVDSSVVASAMSAKPEISPVLHPISIYVNFTPTCIGTSITMSPLTTGTPILRSPYIGHTLSKPDSFAPSSFVADTIIEDIKPVIRSKPKDERMQTLTSTSSRLTHTSNGSYVQESCEKPIKEITDLKPDFLDYSEVTHPPSKYDETIARISVSKSMQEFSKETPMGRNLHHVPELRHHDVIPRLCKMRDIRDNNTYHHNHLMNMNHHTGNSLSSHHHPHSVIPNLASQTSAGVHTHNSTGISTMISAFSAPQHSLLSANIPHHPNIQNHSSHSSRMMRDMRNPRDLHHDLCGSTHSSRDHFEPTYTAGFHRAAMPWPYQLPSRQFKV